MGDAPRGLFGQCELCDQPATHRGEARSTQTIRLALCCHHYHGPRDCGAAGVCCLPWQGPRADAPSSVWVNHVCGLPIEHEGDCACACGAVQD